MDQDINPYRPPTAAVVTNDKPDTGRALAGKGRRFAGFLIDYILYNVFAFIVGVVLALSGAGALIEGMNRGEAFLFGLVVYFAYYLLFEGLFNRTPGKFALGTRVVAVDGGSPRLGAIAGRTLARLVPFEAFTFFGETGFHDKASGTRVVMVR